MGWWYVQTPCPPVFSTQVSVTDKHNSQGQGEAGADEAAHWWPPRLSMHFSRFGDGARVRSELSLPFPLNPPLLLSFSLSYFFCGMVRKIWSLASEPTTFEMHHGSAKVGCRSAVGSGLSARRAWDGAFLFFPTFPPCLVGCIYWTNGYHVALSVLQHPWSLCLDSREKLLSVTLRLGRRSPRVLVFRNA